MNREAVAKLIDRWINDAAFRQQMRADPEGTVRRTGAELDASEWAALRAIDWSLTDDELKTRANKGI